MLAKTNTTVDVLDKIIDESPKLLFYYILHFITFFASFGCFGRCCRFRDEESKTKSLVMAEDGAKL